jgi:hypothetical protein
VKLVLSEAYGGEAMKESSVFQLHERFKAGRENVERERSGRPRSHGTNENVGKVRIWCIYTEVQVLELWTKKQ